MLPLCCAASNYFEFAFKVTLEDAHPDPLFDAEFTRQKGHGVTVLGHLLCKPRRSFPGLTENHGLRPKDQVENS